MANLALRADLWYIGDRKLVCLEDAVTSPKRVHLGRRCTVTTVSHAAHEDNPSFVIISLTQGYNAVVDSTDADLAQLHWQITRGRYAMRRPRIEGKKSVELMHRVILERKLGRPLAPKMIVDHINGNGLDNRRANLREATVAQNAGNRNPKDGKGVTFKRGKWAANIGYHGQIIYLGQFDTKDLALEAYDLAAIKLFGEFARTNQETLEDTAQADIRAITSQHIPLPHDDEARSLDASFVTIPMNLGKVALVDPIDADLASVKWFLDRGRYAGRRTENHGKGKHHSMHRIILERKLGRPIKEGLRVDHINGDGLDNRRANLREVTQAQNMQNTRLRQNNTHRYKGVGRVGLYTWEAEINGQVVGYFDTVLDASFAYDKAALEQYGEFAHLNHSLEEVHAWKPPMRQFGRKSASGYRGVQPCGDRWIASIHNQGLHYYLGSFETAEAAAYAYDKEALRIFGKKATLNHAIEEVKAWIPPARMLRKTNTSGYRGVRKLGEQRWYAQIHAKGQRAYLGTFDTPGEAARAYDRAAIKAYGESAQLNFLKEDYNDD